MGIRAIAVINHLIGGVYTLIDQENGTILTDNMSVMLNPDDKTSTTFLTNLAKNIREQNPDLEIDEVIFLGNDAVY